MAQTIMGRSISILLTPIATIGSYFFWLGWHTPKHVQPNGRLTGPYEIQQVLGFILTLTTIAIVITWWSKTAWITSIMMTAATTAYFSVEGATDVNSDGLWPVGAMLVMIGTALGVSVVSVITTAMRKHA